MWSATGALLVSPTRAGAVEKPGFSTLQPQLGLPGAPSGGGMGKPGFPYFQSTTTWTSGGPWMPSERVISMSAVRDGPLMKVRWLVGSKSAAP